MLSREAVRLFVENGAGGGQNNCNSDFGGAEDVWIGIGQ